MSTLPFNNTCPFKAKDGNITPYIYTEGFKVYECCGSHTNKDKTCKLTPKINEYLLNNKTTVLDELKNSITDSLSEISDSISEEKQSTSDKIGQYKHETLQDIDDEVNDLREGIKNDKTLYLLSEENFDAFSNEITKRTEDFGNKVNETIANFVSGTTEKVKLLENKLKEFGEELKALKKEGENYEEIRTIHRQYNDFLKDSITQGKALFKSLRTESKYLKQTNKEAYNTIMETIPDQKQEFYLSEDEIEKFINSSARQDLENAVSSLNRLASRVEHKMNLIVQNEDLARGNISDLLSNSYYPIRKFSTAENFFETNELFQNVSESFKLMTVAFNNLDGVYPTINRLVDEVNQLITKSNTLMDDAKRLLEVLDTLNNAVLTKYDRIDLDEADDQNDALSKRRDNLKRIYDSNYDYFEDTKNTISHKTSAIEHGQDRLSEMSIFAINYKDTYNDSKETFEKISKLLVEVNEFAKHNFVRKFFDYLEYEYPEKYADFLGPELHKEDRGLRTIVLLLYVISILLLSLLMSIMTLAGLGKCSSRLENAHKQHEVSQKMKSKQENEPPKGQESQESSSSSDEFPVIPFGSSESLSQDETKQIRCI